MKRGIAIILLCVLCMTYSLTAYAGSSSADGYTTPAGTYGTLHAYANLYCTSYMASASTGVYNTNAMNVTFATSITASYTDINGNPAYASNAGTVSAGVSVGTQNIKRATSYHSVNGGSYWGNWSCTLTAAP